MSNKREGGRIRDPLEEGEDKSTRPGTSSTDNEDPSYIGRPGKQRPSSSGTTSITSEPSDSGANSGPGGVEGEKGSQ